MVNLLSSGGSDLAWLAAADSYGWVEEFMQPSQGHHRDA